MRTCPRCGWPKEVHDVIDGATSQRMPKAPAPSIRLCVMEEVDLVGPELEVPVFRADAAEYRRRLAAL